MIEIDKICLDLVFERNIFFKKKVYLVSISDLKLEFLQFFLKKNLLTFETTNLFSNWNLQNNKFLFLKVKLMHWHKAAEIS